MHSSKSSLEDEVIDDLLNDEYKEHYMMLVMERLSEIVKKGIHEK